MWVILLKERTLVGADYEDILSDQIFSEVVSMVAIHAEKTALSDVVGMLHMRVLHLARAGKFDKRTLVENAEGFGAFSARPGTLRHFYVPGDQTGRIVCECQEVAYKNARPMAHGITKWMRRLHGQPSPSGIPEKATLARIAQINANGSVT